MEPTLLSSGGESQEVLAPRSGRQTEDQRRPTGNVGAAHSVLLGGYATGQAITRSVRHVALLLGGRRSGIARMDVAAPMDDVGVAADQPGAPATASEGEAMNRMSRVRVIKKCLQAGLF